MHVPYRRKTEIDAMAMDLLQKYYVWKGKKITVPINVDDIIEGYFNLDLQFTDLKSLLQIPDVLGATWFEDNVMRIDSSLEDREGRLAFTMAHEIGHWWVHRPIYEMEKVSLPLFSYGENYPPTPALVCRSARKKEPAEWQADQFAAMLLMPAPLVRAAVANMHGPGPILIEKLEEYSRNAADNPILRQTAKLFIDEHDFSNVSIEAMCYRLTDLKCVADANPRQHTLFS
ncbi:ImmA/IrrE family metallo-endopeptidase [Geobacter argillaceus]|uniref:Uncharacterized protein DUF955 n=1 Tax=Geobacter argillaceus TaxID=345631 RepID=A0A562VP09_9BACT|nr:ImmA/IrrE family metallo-endopeptidase [Geobacter argillaceus]TWJ19716.1 uncharacterized protein DUF955 [Geobacter argillaceus]